MSLIINNLEKHYKTVTAVNKLSFDVQPGEIFALLGPNGAGKSSLVKMIVGFSSPDSGSIQLNDAGQAYSSIPAHLLGYLPEDRGLYPEKTIKQNLQFFAALHGVKDSEFTQRCDYWLAKFNLTARLNDPLKSLSKGNQQKIQLITAILHKPKWVILDEPFSGLDPINQELVVEFLAQLKQQGMTVILSAHQMAMVEKLADRVLLLNQGESVLYGKLSNILQSAQNNSIQVVFNDPINQTYFEQLCEHYCVEQIKAQQLTITLKQHQSLNQLLPQLISIGEICELKNKAQSLHAIYLHAVAEHNAKLDQGTTL
ncbi:MULTISPECIES: ABC transporter ATP-binding protein [Pseudoalteromonas]|jgi:ABC-2 type transport system ATP-binding protein|uniref:ABC transporter ATP-binding protein n=1 Tax=Pseudoalteromonas TaxID=53246 RepID=UPI0012306C60|nr:MULTISPECIES: ATP-binding cassette domain-containing protein [Pseudoalteromonas]MBB1300406.1 ABC transporter ATP-binding protein [Pseudoalteromonas sp. SR44-8]MBB1308313.1 ABC transporter ATP-binding protein [Pseudoalteromonas sp. SR41-8]MBB1340181.1 ABC transporter ATP-binding protein [Pseudoalteromonas sp. SR45-6]MBB1397429.1 ABC transporter ATP-binding protein [Pseudoalteromonas sp. SG44-8]MBB1408970.1 ABC transporter ATP-binding protein [Pseudoalteromonas sp. SG44-17]